MNDHDNAVEILAAIEHDRWARWMQWVYKHGRWNVDGSFTINADKAERWHRLADTDYADLDEPTQEWDRVEARKSLDALKRLVEWTP